MKEKYEVKLPKNEESKGKPEIKNLEQSPIPIQEKLESTEKTENKKVSFVLEKSINPIIKTKENERKKDLTKKLRFSEDDDIKKMRMKIKKNISKFLDDFIEENKIKRANSMMSLRSSKTISSVTTCDDSICLDDTNVGKYKINLNTLIVGNDEKNNKTKEMVQRSKNLFQVYLDQQQDLKDTKNKCGKLTLIGMQKHKTSFNLIMNMSPKFKEIEEELEGVNIEYKDKTKNIIDNISIDLLLKKIIFENFLEKNNLLIYHFCQQCFCFVTKDILFKKLFDCYKIYKEKKIPLDKIKNLIEFINILVVEMNEYYEKVNLKDMQILLIKKFFSELISDLIDNFEEGEKKIEKKINNNIINKDLTTNKRFYRFNSIDITGESYMYNISNIDFKFDKENLLNTDLNLDIKNINIFFYKDKEDVLDWSCLNESDIKDKEKNKEKDKEKNKEKEKEKNKEKEPEMISEIPKFYQISKTLRRSLENSNINKSYKNKYLSKIDEDIKEENKEEEFLYSDNEEDDLDKKEKEKEDYSFEELKSSSDEEINNIKEENDLEEKKKSETINNLINKAFPNNDKIISTREELMNEIDYILPLLDVKDKENIYLPSIREAKSIIPFYADVKLKKKLTQNNTNEIKNANSYNYFEKTRTNTINENSLRSNNINNFSSNKNYFCITDWSPEDIGNKLAQVTESLLNKIKPRELYKGIYLKKDKEKTSPNIVKCINSFNKLTSFIIEDILSYSTPKLRARSYEKWVQICDYCKSNKNYNDCIAIFSALNNYIITGLNLTLKEIKYKTKGIFEQIKIFCSVEGNYKNIRNDMNLCEQRGENFIPYLGMLLRDINFLEESNKYINERGCVNMDKIEKINSLLEKYFKYKKDEKKKSDDNKKVIKELSFFQDLEILSEEELENIASNVEPEYKFDKNEVKRLTNIDKKYFVEKNILKKRTTIAGTNPFFGKKINYSKFFD